jgi:hypothetical protein
VRPAWVPKLAFLEQKISEMESLALEGRSKAVIEQLHEMVPMFRLAGPNGSAQVSPNAGPSLFPPPDTVRWRT